MIEFRLPGLAQDARLVVEDLPSLRAYLACRPGHPLTREPAPTLKRVFEFPLVTTVLRGAHAALLSAGGQAAAAHAPGAGDFVPPIVVNSVALARMIARENNAMALGTAATLAEDVAAGRLVMLGLDAPAVRNNGGPFFLRDRTLAPATRLFIESLRAVEDEVQAADVALIAALAAAHPVVSPRRAARAPT